MRRKHKREKITIIRNLVCLIIVKPNKFDFKQNDFDWKKQKTDGLYKM